MAKRKKKNGKRLKVGRIRAWGLVDVKDKTYAMALFRKTSARRMVFRVYEFDDDGILYVQPISQWEVIGGEYKIFSKWAYGEMANCIASEYYDIYSLRDKTIQLEDVIGKKGPVIVYGYCAGRF